MTDTAVRFSDEELEKLKNLQDSYSQIVNRHGELHFQKKVIEMEQESLDNEYMKLLNDRENIVRELQSKYGQGFVDINTGVFTPSQQ